LYRHTFVPYAEQGLCICRASIRPSVRLSVPAGGFLLWARAARDIDRLLHGAQQSISVRMRAVPRCQRTYSLVLLSTNEQCLLYST